MKNICKTTNNGKDCFCVHIQQNGKRKRKFFDSMAKAKEFLKSFKFQVQVGKADLLQNMTDDELNDLRLARKLLPEGLGLLDCVKIALNKQQSSKSLDYCKIEFIRIKASSDITQKEKNSIENRINKLKGSFDNYDGSYLLDFVKKMNLAPKTSKDYLALYKSFFNWAKTRQYITLNPFDSVHSVDIPKPPKQERKFASIEDISKFFDTCKAKYPKLVTGFALVAFAGIRQSEAFKLKNSDIDYTDKTIKIRAEISKTGDNWLQTNLPDNIWAWLEKHKIKPIPEKSPTNAYSKINKTLKLPHNALRHSFATYHLSLHRDAPKTSLLLKHKNPTMLWQHYLGGLVSKTEAQKYFDIKP